MKKFRESRILFAILFLCMLGVFGGWADRNLYRYKWLGESSSNYEFVDVTGNTDIQTEYNVNFPLKTAFVDVNGLIRRIAGEREMNGETKMNNGHLTEVLKEYDQECLDQNAAAIIQYSQYCKDNGIGFIFVQPGYGISKWDNQLPEGVVDMHNEALDYLLSKLSDNDVETLDLREEMHRDDISEYDMYYATDHHWTTEGGFYGYQKVARRIQEDTNTYLDESLLDPDNYQVDRYKGWHLGSRGQRTGKLFEEPDDYDLIYPKFETHILNNGDGSVSSIYDALVNTSVFESHDATNRYTYDWAYVKSDINQLSSLDAKTDLNVLLLSDSYQQAIKQYMLLTYKSFHIGAYNSLSTSVLQAYEPDMVIILPYASNIIETDVQFVDDIEETEQS